MKMDGKTLMKQNYETLLDLSYIDKVKIITLRNAILQLEKTKDKVFFKEIYIYINKLNYIYIYVYIFNIPIKILFKLFNIIKIKLKKNIYIYIFYFFFFIF